ncbi:MAG: alanine--tRNA ligase [Acidobacteriota bacterium]|nr:alanine--tRNA ligase [Blastocatellia bacterium]MDW8412561.1 alanine--tRNA ligase [Acidobacteriota bacterium]
MITGHEIRKSFLDYFARHGHTIVRSSPLLPANDPTLLFANAGMNQFKDVFLGLEKRDYTKAASSQKCIRAGGKHNDLEEVGKTARHHTFFEMLGNFSFGDYFKEEAIVYAWEFLLKELKLPLERLWFTVYCEDDEAAELWKKVGAPQDRILRFDEKDNFWQMGETGPCGPCTEIHYYTGEDLNRQGPELVNGHGDDCIEIWNLVFMQFNRDETRKLTPLPKPSVDTGMGLERITAVMQGVKSNYDTDLILPIVQYVSELCGRRYDYSSSDGMSMRVIADHARATAFAIADGILPGNDGRSYVLRKIMRRAIYHGSHRLGMRDLFFHKVTDFVAHLMAVPYPELLASRNFCEKVVEGEERRFRHTLETCLPRFYDLMERSGGQMPKYKDLARLYDTYGLPPDLMKVMLQQQGYTFDQQCFDEAIAELQNAQAVAYTAVTRTREIYQKLAERLPKTEFTGYETTETLAAKVLTIVSNDKEVEVLSEGQQGEVVLSKTPFYAESGGQIGDSGVLENANTVVAVVDTVSPVSGLIVHKVKVKQGSLNVGDEVAALVDSERRRRIMLNHTATHLLHAALKEVLGNHVKQAGSLVAPDRLRFDFTHTAALTQEEITEIERLVNEQIQRNVTVTKQEMELEQALSSGAVALFGEKYSSRVRVVTVPGFSKELCGGTHVAYTGEIGLFKLISDSSISAGVRRIEAVTGPVAIERYQQASEILDGLAHTFKVSWSDLQTQIEKLQQQLKQAEAEVSALKLKLAEKQLADAAESALSINGIKVLARRVEQLERSAMRRLADELSHKLGSSVVVLGMEDDGKAALVVRVSSDLNQKIHAGKIVKQLAAIVGGGGGGRPDLAEAGGREVAKLDDALQAAYATVEAMLSQG